MKHCSDCKYFEYKPNVAHQNRCKRFPENGSAVPIAVVRVAGGKCARGKAFRAK